MVRFLTTHTAAAEIEGLIVGARERLVLISPFLRLSQLFSERLRDAAERGVAITIVYGKSELAREQYDMVARLARSELYFLPNLHAKCYYNEESMVITSMNMYEFSEKSNREMGVLLDANEPAFRDAVAEAVSIISAAQREHVVGRRADHAPLHSSRAQRGELARPGARERGTCIRCGRKVALDPSRPLCSDDYQIWSDFQNPDYPESFCHACGRRAETSMRRPLCYHCFRRLT